MKGVNTFLFNQAQMNHAVERFLNDRFLSINEEPVEVLDVLAKNKDGDQEFTIRVRPRPAKGSLPAS